ncbi:MAG: hemolysin III family protein [Mariniphaga sp.]|nr:hemolysin III family protein [Mariniphaga sp.]
MSTEKYYTPFEERLNVITHGFGFILALLGSILLLNRGLQEGIHLRFISYLIYSFGLLTLYLASTLYHSAKIPKLKKRLNIFDHSAIYVLIAGTYSPIALLSMKGTWGLVIFCIVWILAIIGIILKFFFIGRYSKFSTATYVLMGWVVVIAIKPLIDSMATQGLIWLLAGGFFYTIGALLYQRKSMKYNHAIFHVFVLLGSIFHYIVIFNYTN